MIKSTLGPLPRQTRTTTLAGVEQQLKLPSGSLKVQGLARDQTLGPGHLVKAVEIPYDFVLQSTHISHALQQVLLSRDIPQAGASGLSEAKQETRLAQAERSLLQMRRSKA